MDLNTEIQRAAERCVACGLCVPLCPTYRKTLNEADSPRGRLALALALVRGELAWSKRLQSHLDLCLDCRACERACPSEVAYGRLYDLAHTRLGQLRPGHRWRRRLRRFVLDTLTSPRRLDCIGRLARLYQRSGLQALMRRSRLLELIGLDAADRYLPRLRRAEPLAGFYPASKQPRRGAVALFTGCIARLADPDTLLASVRLLSRLGYDVHVPPEQGCCGALYQHSGELAAARKRMQVNLRAFGSLPVDAIVVTASGCAAMLREYPQWLDDKVAEGFSAKINEVCAFLARAGALEAERLAPLPQRRIAVHDPCTLANVLRETEPVYGLLRRIPAAEVFPLPENHLCCGAAGLYPLLEPEMAERLRADKLASLRRLAPDILATSNVGCAMYLAAGLREAGLAIEVVHPVVLLERQWRASSAARPLDEGLRWLTDRLV